MMMAIFSNDNRHFTSVDFDTHNHRVNLELHYYLTRRMVDVGIFSVVGNFRHFDRQMGENSASFYCISECFSCKTTHNLCIHYVLVSITMTMTKCYNMVNDSLNVTRN